MESSATRFARERSRHAVVVACATCVVVVVTLPRWTVAAPARSTDVRALGGGRGSDDQPVVQRLLDEGRAIYFPRGTYKFERPLVIRKNDQRVVCEDTASTVLRAEFRASLPIACEPREHACPPNAVPQDVCPAEQRKLCPFAPQGLDALVEAQNVSGLTWTGCRLVGPSSAEGPRGVDLSSVRSARISKMDVEGFTQSSVRVLESSVGVILEDVHTSRQTRRSGIRDGEAQIFVRSLGGEHLPRDVECLRCQTRGGGDDVNHWDRGIYFSQVENGRMIDVDSRDHGGNNLCVGGGLDPYVPSRNVTIRGGKSFRARGNGLYFYNSVVNSRVDGLESAQNAYSGISLKGRHFDNQFGRSTPNHLHDNGEAGFMISNSDAVGHNVTSDIAEDNSVGFYLSHSPGTSLIHVISRAGASCAVGTRQRFGWSQPRARRCTANGVVIDAASQGSVIDGGTFTDNINFGIRVEEDAKAPAGERSINTIKVPTRPNADNNGRGGFSSNLAPVVDKAPVRAVDGR